MKTISFSSGFVFLFYVFSPASKLRNIIFFTKKKEGGWGTAVRLWDRV